MYVVIQNKTRVSGREAAMTRSIIIIVFITVFLCAFSPAHATLIINGNNFIYDMIWTYMVCPKSGSDDLE
jgi:hypothetical protein